MPHIFLFINRYLLFEFICITALKNSTFFGGVFLRRIYINTLKPNASRACYKIRRVNAKCIHFVHRLFISNLMTVNVTFCEFWIVFEKKTMYSATQMRICNSTIYVQFYNYISYKQERAYIMTFPQHTFNLVWYTILRLDK